MSQPKGGTPKYGQNSVFWAVAADNDHCCFVNAMHSKFSDDSSREAALAEYRAHEPGPIHALDELTSLAAELCRVPISGVCIFRGAKVEVVSAFGVPAMEVPREQSICTRVLNAKAPLVLNDTLEHGEVPRLPIVLKAGIRFYAGWPLITPSGTIVGAISICDFAPRKLTQVEERVLETFAKIVISHLEAKKANDSLQQLTQSLETARERAEASELALRTAMESLDHGFVIQDVQGEIIVANEAACLMLGLTLDQLMGRTSIDPRWRSIHEDGSDYPGEDHPAMRTLRTGTPVTNDRMGVHKPDGEVVWLEIRSRPLIRPGATQPHGVVTVFSDITEARQTQLNFEQEMVRVNEMNIALELQSLELEEENSTLSRLAMTDGLTELANRRHFQESLAAAFLSSQASGRPLSLLLLDVDRFKSYNDTYGHPEGDKVLKEVARSLTRVLPEGSLAARYGGEEFAVLLPGWDCEEAVRLAETIRRAISDAPMEHRPVTASLGVAVRESGDRAPLDLVIRADEALYRAKKMGRNRVETAWLEAPSAAA